MDKNKFYIGEGPVALEIIAEVKAGLEARRKARQKLQGDVVALSFYGIWTADGSSGAPVEGVASKERLSAEEELARGVTFYAVMRDGSCYAYKPRRNTKGGKKLKAMIDEANKSVFSHGKHIIRRTGMEYMVLTPRNLRLSSACCTDDRIFVRVPVPTGVDHKEVAGKAPVPPVWFREVLESEWLAGLRR